MDSTHWTDQPRLVCREHDPEVFFPETPDGVDHAKALCRGCPALRDCLAAALEREEPWGVWGGEWFVAGAVVTAKRPPGRPRRGTTAPEVVPADAALARVAASA